LISSQTSQFTSFNTTLETNVDSEGNKISKDGKSKTGKEAEINLAEAF
jgi:hypothetical protein